MKIYPELIWRQLQIDAPFQWHLRHLAAGYSSYTLDALAQEDNALEAQLDALRIGLEADMSPIAQHDVTDKGMVFVLTVLALRMDRLELLQPFLDNLIASTEDKQLEIGEELFQALQWQQPTKAQIQFFLKQEYPQISQAVIATFPSVIIEETVLQQWFSYNDKPIILRLLAYIGFYHSQQVYSQKVKNYVRRFFHADDSEIRFKAACTAVLLGDDATLDVFKPFVSDNSDHVSEALLWLICFSKKEQISQFVNNILNKDFPPRIQALCIAYSGFVQYIPCLFPLMLKAKNARVAGEAFSLITGLNLVDNNFDDIEPQGADKSETIGGFKEQWAFQRNYCADQYQDYEENLPWPQPKAIAQWWQQHGQQFDHHSQYLSGQRITRESLHTILQTGRQAERHIAALHLAAMGEPYISVYEKVSKQRAHMTRSVAIPEEARSKETSAWT